MPRLKVARWDRKLPDQIGDRRYYESLAMEEIIYHGHRSLSLDPEKYGRFVVSGFSMPDASSTGTGFNRQRATKSSFYGVKYELDIENKTTIPRPTIGIADINPLDYAYNDKFQRYQTNLPIIGYYDPEYLLESGDFEYLYKVTDSAKALLGLVILT